MSRTSKKFFFFFASLIVLVVAELFYLQSYHGMEQTAREQKKAFVSLVGLPDLALATEADYIRHRSLSSYFSLFKEGPMAREYYVTTSMYQPAQNYFTELPDAH